MKKYELLTVRDVQLNLSQKFKLKRLELGLKQQTLAERADLSLRSLQRFESEGSISFESLLKISQVLGVLEEFNQLIPPSGPSSIADLEAPVKKAKRGYK